MAIWLIRLSEGAEWALPAASPGLNRMLHCFEGDRVRVATETITTDIGVRLRSDAPSTIVAESGPAEFLLLQGRPIGAPVIQVGPFVMNSPEEIQTAMADYRRTQFGGWPWTSPSPVHDREMGRFAVHADGRIEHRDMPPRLAHVATDA